jgi:anti-anti-sigma factor
MAETARVTVEVEEDGTNITITGSGELDLTNAQELRDPLSIAAATAENVTIDLRAAAFIDTAILECLARAAKTMLGRNKRLKVIAAENSHPLYVLETVGFAALMDIVVEPSNP